MKEKIVLAVLKDLANNYGQENLQKDIIAIQMKIDGYEELVDNYATQIIKMLNSNDEVGKWRIIQM